MDDRSIVNTSSIINKGIPMNNSTCLEDKDTSLFIINAFIIGILCIFGFLGNTLSILILQKDRKNRVAIFLLQALAVADNLLLLVSFVALSLWKGFLTYFHNDGDHLRNSILYIPVIINPLGYMTQTATIWVTVLLALNRFIAVCRPFDAHKFSTLKRAKFQVMCVLCFAVGFNFPRFFQHRITTAHVLRGINETLWTNVTELRLEPTCLNDNTMFGIVYTNALYSILVLLLPLILLVVLNTKIILELRSSTLRHTRRASTQGLPAPSDDNISFVMVVIIVVFIVCQTPDRVLQIFSVLIFSRHDCSLTRERLIAVCNLLIIVNSSTNFVIYYVFRSSFRKILKSRLCFESTTAEDCTMNTLNIQHLLESASESIPSDQIKPTKQRNGSV